MRYLSVCLVVSIMFLINACGSKTQPPTSSLPNGESGSANITVKIGNVGSLAKSATIEFAKLCVSLSASGETPIYDTIPISGNGTNTVSKTYGPLASLKTWTLNVHSLDARDSIIHSGSTTFNVLPRQTVTIPVLDLSAHFSMLKANFFPIRDSVTRCELLVDGINVNDSSFAKQSLIGDTVRLDYDYLKTNVSQRIKMDVYGSMWGFDTLLYTGDTAITPLPGVNSTYAITLKWVGPSLPPPGQATMTVILGAVGTVTIEGTLKPEIPEDGLVAYYPFNGTANDESGNANNGTVNGAALTIDRFGVVNKAYMFDGIDDKIIVSSSPSLSYVNTHEFSISLWINTTTNSGDNSERIFISQDDGAGNAFIYVVMEPFGNYSCGVTEGMQWKFMHSSTPITTGQWHNVVMTVNNNTTKLYVDNLMIGQLNYSNINWAFNTADMVIGSGLSGGIVSPINGKMDDIRLYKKVLSESEIRALYREGGWLGN